MPRIEIDTVPVRTGSGYPEPHASEMAGRSSQKLGDAAGLTQFGANLVRLEPGATSSLRHWHETEDEFVWVTEGELVLVEDDGETVLRPGDAAAFPAGVPNGHHLVNRSGAPGAFLVIGTRSPAETAHYSDVDMMVTSKNGRFSFTRRDGSPL